MNLNKVTVAGYITRDPELKALPSGVNVVSFSVATNRVWKDANGAKREEADFHNILAFGGTAENIARYFKKGSPIYVEGRMQTRTWEHTTHKINMYRTEVIVERFQFFPKNSAASSSSSAPADNTGVEFPEEEINPEDIPF